MENCRFFFLLLGSSGKAAQTVRRFNSHNTTLFHCQLPVGPVGTVGKSDR